MTGRRPTTTVVEPSLHCCTVGDVSVMCAEPAMTIRAARGHGGTDTEGSRRKPRVANPHARETRPSYVLTIVDMVIC